MSAPPVSNPYSTLRNLRAKVLATYEKRGLDIALKTLNSERVPPTMRAGVHAELIFYDRYRTDFALEPLLDAGSKADFTGNRPRRSIPINFDVTTNLDYKDIDEYVNCIQTRGRRYEIALVNLKTEEVTFFPLRFPICHECSRFSYYLIYLVPSTSTTYSTVGISDDQRVVRYCPWCDDGEEVRSYNYEVRSLSYAEEDMSSELDVDESARYSSAEIRDAIDADATSIIRFFRRLSRLELSGVAENHERMVGYKDNFETIGKLYWKHPLARKLDDEIDFHYGSWNE
jgi:hypothetical protein